jgi:Protein of unknown function (DUF3016)
MKEANIMLKRKLLAIAALAAAPSLAAVDVSFVSPEKYTDASNERWELDSNLKTLAEHMRKAGERYIAANETLRIEVLDVDLAGWSQWGGRDPNKLRVARGGADFPQMRFRYTLESPGRSARSGEADLRDLGYQNSGLRSRAASEPMYYEKRMIDEWFRSTFAQRAQ